MKEDQKVRILIAGCRNQDELSQIELYKLFYSYGMSICLRYASNRESAVEMLNDGFLKVFQKIDHYDQKLPFKPWLRKVLVNAAIDHYRKYELTIPLEIEELSMTTTSYNEVLDQIEYDHLMQIIQQLTPAYRLVFNLHVIEGHSHAEIAAQTGISIGASKSNLAKARRKIKEYLNSLAVYSKPDRYG